MAIKKAIFKIFNGSTWDEYHHKTDSAQVAHTNSDNSKQQRKRFLTARQQKQH